MNGLIINGRVNSNKNNVKKNCVVLKPMKHTGSNIQYKCSEYTLKFRIYEKESQDLSKNTDLETRIQNKFKNMD